MHTFRPITLGALVIALAALPALAQTPTATLTGRVTSSDGQPLSGVTVSANSPALQGTRTTLTSNAGDYHLPFLPPGDYSMRFELGGFATEEREARAPLGQTTSVDATMILEAVSEAIVVTASFEAISSTSQAATTYEKDLVDKLPVGRTIREAVLLAPGAAASGPGGNISISGNMSFENLFLVNGVVVTENIRGQPFDLFIEDAIEETTISTSGISAEYGRFGGGVVNTITKSGGNEIKGSLRMSLDNQNWVAETPLTVARDDTTNETVEGTLGGWLWRDHLWFFLAGRDRGTESIAQTAVTAIPFDHVRDQQRYEGKLTGSLNPSHRFVGTYLKIDDEEQGNRFLTVLDLASLNNRQTPQDLLAFHYTGVLTSNFFVEGQYSEREFLFVNSGSKFTDLIQGTLFVDRQGRRWNSPTFCGVCRDEERSNENLLLKASYFLSTPRLGSHDIVVGYDTFNDIRAADNHQSGSDYRIVNLDTIMVGSGPSTQLFPSFIPGVTFIQWNPIFETTRGTAFNTNSVFVNDSWRVSDRLNLNLGLRYDVNDGKDAGHNKVIDDSKLSPRIGAAYDLRGGGDMMLYGSFARYVNAIANSQAGAGSAAGSPASITWFYRGPAINPDGTSQLIPTAEALQMLWDWFFSVGGTDNPDLRSISIPGGATVVGSDMKSPHTDEISIGISKRLGARGIVRADYVRREGADFYIDRRDTSIGTVQLPSGQIVDKSVIGNESDQLERVYDGLHTQVRFRISNRLEAGGTWAWSHARGTWNGETGGSGPVRSALGQYPEYRAFEQHLVRGDLDTDQRHRARLWVTWDVLSLGANRLNLSVLQNYATGQPYGAVGSVDPRPHITNTFGYRTPPASVAYHFTSPHAFRTDTITATDLALVYSFVWNAFGLERLEVLVRPAVTNVFNEDGVIGVNTTVLTRVNSTAMQAFNPFTDTPAEGVHWAKHPDFGTPSSPASFQDPRTFVVSMGLRF
ncbi:MAG TPA: carboxypeptidase regulatory-like domain-containing protein [Thermoanaerobaculia bacterium]|nr:carboxypeptidase regulatory-like domain-containing protein [Thermoanaerobaculia bacterium]